MPFWTRNSETPCPALCAIFDRRGSVLPLRPKNATTGLRTSFAAYHSPRLPRIVSRARMSTRSMQPSQRPTQAQ